MSSIIKLIFWTIAIFCIIFLIFSAITINKYKKSKSIKRLPEPFRSLYYKLQEFPFMSGIINKYNTDFYLIKGSRDLGRLYVSVYCSVIPSLSILLVMLIFINVHTWYFALGISVFGITTPYLSFTNGIKGKSLLLKYSMIKTYESSGTYFSDGVQVLDAFQEIAGNCSGASKIVYKNFCDSYILDKEKAYEEFMETLEDKYATSFIKSVMNYDQLGVNPCRSIQNLTEMGKRHYSVIFKNRAGVGGYKMLSCMVLGMNILFNFAAKGICATMNKPNKLEFLSYIGISGCIFCVLLCLMYERQ